MLRAAVDKRKTSITKGIATGTTTLFVVLVALRTLVLVTAGLGVVSYGIAMINKPAGVIMAGISLLVIEYLSSSSDDGKAT